MNEKQTVPGFVYVVGNDSGKVRIGKSAEPVRRIRAIQTEGGFGNDRVFISDEVSDCDAAEARLHILFYKDRFVGDWFHIDFDEAVRACREITGSPATSLFVTPTNGGLQSRPENRTGQSFPSRKNQTESATVDFHGRTLITVLHNGAEYVAMRPIFEGIGLDRKAQTRKIKVQKVGAYHPPRANLRRCSGNALHSCQRIKRLAFFNQP